MKREIISTPEEINEYKEVIKSESSWVEHIAQKAKKRGLSLDSMIILDAIYMFDTKGPKFKEGSTLEDIVKLIHETPEWLETIKKQAMEKGENLDTAIKNNALYVIEERKKK